MKRHQVTLLVLLELSAAFDTVDHDILVRRLETSFGITGTALKWFRSYLAGRSQRVSFKEGISDSFPLSCGMPQGSFLDPLLFSMYARKLFDVIKAHLPTQGTVRVRWSVLPLWRISVRMKLNDGKTEV